MGIRGLKTFLSRTCPETLQHERIDILADLHRRKNGFNGRVQIVVDGPTCAFEIYGETDMRCGGQFDAFKTRIREFVDAFKRLDISLVFFFIGCIPEDETEKWMTRKLKDEGVKRFEWTKLFFYLTIKALYKDDEYVEVYSATKGKRTITVCQYAIDNNCLAILSDDSSYFIYDTIPIFSCKDLDLNEMTTTVVDHKYICEQLQCSQTQLQCMAALKYGNCQCYLSFYDHLKDLFHVNFYPRYEGASTQFYPNFRMVIRYIKSFINVNDTEIGNVIANEIKNNGCEEAVQFFKDSFVFYCLGQMNTTDYRLIDDTAEFINHESIVQYFNKKVITTDILPTALEAITNGKIIIRTAPIIIVDQIDQTLPNLIELFRPVRQRFYGLIFNSLEIEQKNICEIWSSVKTTQIWPSAELQIMSENVEPISTMFNNEKESLTMLWKNKTLKSPENEIVQVNCLLKCFGISTDNSLQEIPKKFHPIAVILQYMFKNSNINLEDYEVDAFVVQAILLNSDSKLWDEVPFTSLETRACHLAELFVQGILLYVDVAMCCCLDFEPAMPWNYFDGQRFQYCYQELKKGTPAMQLLLLTQSKNVNDYEQLKVQLPSFIKD